MATKISSHGSQRKPANDPLLPGPRREARMLELLETIFLRDGFRNVTVAQLAGELRCSKRTIYLLAQSKEELFLRVFDRYLSRLREEGARGAMTVRPEEAFVPYLSPAIAAASRLSANLMRDMTAFGPANEMWERHQRERMAGLRQIVERCVNEGIFRHANADLVAEIFAASLRRIRDPLFLAASNLSYREAVAELYELLLHGLLHEDPAAPTRVDRLGALASSGGRSEPGASGYPDAAEPGTISHPR